MFAMGPVTHYGPLAKIIELRIMLRKHVFLVARRETPQHRRARVVMNTGVKLILNRVVRNSKPNSVPSDFGSG